MTSPLSRNKLHRMGRRDRSASSGSRDLECTLDSLLNKDGKQQGQAEPMKDTPPPPKSPIDEMRDCVTQRLIPLALSVADRYCDKGIDLILDASDLLGGGRGITIEITFKGSRLILEGTVMPESIAFNETHYTCDGGGTVSGGPTLRGPGLSDEGFADFLYQRIIAQVRAAGAGSPI